MTERYYLGKPWVYNPEISEEENQLVKKLWEEIQMNEKHLDIKEEIGYEKVVSVVKKIQRAWRAHQKYWRQIVKERKEDDELAIIENARDEILLEKVPPCVLCGTIWMSKYGMNNPAPLAESGKCCDDCNRTKVLPARLSMLLSKKEEEEEEVEEEI